MPNAYETGKYDSPLLESGMTKAELDAKIRSTFERMFFDENERIYFETEVDGVPMGYKACHPETGLNPNQANYDGSPTEFRGQRSNFYSDAYRTALNIALDWQWFGKDPWQQSQAAAIQRFFAQTDKFDYVYDIGGEPVLDASKRWNEPDAMESGMLHPLAVRATTCAASIASNGEHRHEFIELFKTLQLRSDKRRYYDNLLYLFSLLALAGEYKIY